MTEPLSSLVVYWRMDGGLDKFKVPPLEDILKYPPYPAYVNLLAGNLEIGPDDNVSIWVPPEIYEPIGSGRWEGDPSPFPYLASVVKKLQAKGIKVVLSIFSHWEDEEKTKGVGWSTLTTKDNEHLVRKIGQLQETTNIDGIDIDDEWGPKGEPENFYNTVKAIRDRFPHLVISSPIFGVDIQTYTKYYHRDSGKNDLAALMTYCATMNYGNDLHKQLGDFSIGIKDVVQEFISLGIPKEKLYAGVYPGPIFRKGEKWEICDKPPKVSDDQAWTSIEVSKEVAEWAKTKGADGKPNCAGVMIFSFSTDTVEYAGCPIKTGWPNPGDHAWQKAITSVLTAK
jgi:hypothetical protein